MNLPAVAVSLGFLFASTTGRSEEIQPAAAPVVSALPMRKVSALDQPATDPARDEPFVVRPVQQVQSDKWTGCGVAYGPYRAGQRPGGNESPTEEQLAEDLELIVPHWNLIRMYGASDNVEAVLRIIRARQLPIRVMIGAWIAREEILDEHGQFVGDDKVGLSANQREVGTAIRLANEFPNEVFAVCVGNESQVDWSDHRIAAEKLIEYIRQVRAATEHPVTTADDFVFWQKPAAKKLAAEIDFIVAHVYAMWHSRQLEKAMPFTREGYQKVVDAHPDRLIALGEAGWATMMHNTGEQANLIQGNVGEEEQKQFFDDFSAWSREKRIITFYFEAFDEPWKGGPHPDEIEKNWGLFDADRKPKLALAPDASES